MAAAAPFIMLAMTAVSTVSAIKQGNAAADAAEANQKAQFENAQMARSKAAEDEKQFRIFSKKSLADIKSGYAAAGVSLEGSPLDILAESTAAAEYDALKIRRGGEQAARGYENEATYQKIRGEASKQGGYLSAAGSLLKGGGWYAERY